MGTFEHRHTLRVRYSETDQMGIAYPAHYLVWFEAARTDFCRALGTPYVEWEQRGIFLPAVEAHCRYKNPARYDDPLQVLCWVSELKPHSLVFSYRVFREETLLAEGWTKHGICDASGRLIRGENPFHRWMEERVR